LTSGLRRGDCLEFGQGEGGGRDHARILVKKREDGQSRQAKWTEKTNLSFTHHKTQGKSQKYYAIK
jgi:hypothetical protein